MSSPTARVAFEPPVGWAAIDLEKPKIAESTGAVVTQWSAFAGNDDQVVVGGCVATPIPGWVEDMRPSVEARTTALLGSATARIRGGPTDARPGTDGSFELRSASDVTGPIVGRGRTFLGFDGARVVTCVIACAPRRGDAHPDLACASAVAAARLEGSLPPPAPGLALGAATWAIHHPGDAALAGCGVLLVAGVLAVGLRRRPRSTIH